MITIVEGADATGKTTLAKRLAERTGAVYRHAGAPTSANWWQEYVDPIQHEHNMVLDRWHVGELVWPVLFGRPSLFTDKGDYDKCCAELSQAGARLILVIRDEQDIARELAARGEADQTDTVLASQRLFLDAYKDTTDMPKTIADSDSAWSNPCMF